MALTKIDDRGLKTPVDLLDNEKIRLGTGNDLEIYHDGTNSRIVDSGTGDLKIQASTLQLLNAAGDEYYLLGTQNGAVNLYYDNSKKLETTSGGATVTGTLIATANVEANNNIQLLDNGKLLVGSANDLQIYHDSSNGQSIIEESGPSVLKIKASDFRLSNAGNSADYIQANDGGAVKLFFDGGTAKLETTSTGVSINGAVTTKPLAVKGSSGDIVSLSSAATTTGAINTGPSVEFLGHNGSSEVGFAYIHVAKENGNSGDNATYMRFDTRATGGSAAEALRLNSDKSATFAGSVSDSKGNLRSVPQLNKSASYTLIASDAGKHITTNSGITVNPNVLSVGDAVTIINASGSDITITQGSSQTIYNTADASTGNRTLAARGMATMLFTSAGTCYISGAGLS